MTAENPLSTALMLFLEKNTPIAGVFTAKGAINYIANRELLPTETHLVSDVSAAWPPMNRAENNQPTFPNSAPSSNPNGMANDTIWPLGRAVAQLQGIYILAENARGLVIVDMHAAHERIVYERLKTQFESQINVTESVKSSLPSQPLLIPATFAATPLEVSTAQECADTLLQLGLDITAFSPKTLAVRAVPTTLAKGDAVELGGARQICRRARGTGQGLAERIQHGVVHAGVFQAQGVMDGTGNDRRARGCGLA